MIIENNVQSVTGWRIDQILGSDLFGNLSPRPPAYDELLEKRHKILSKKKLTKDDEQELEGISKKIEQLPTAELFDDIEAMDIIQQAADHLK